MNPEIKQSMEEGASSIRWIVRDQQFEVVRIPAGAFLMGSAPSEKGHRNVESPARRITISKAFYIGRHEITQAQYVAVMGNNPSRAEGANLAVDQVTFTAGREFCAKLSALAGATVTMPTEAQWEYACRAGTTSRFHTGESEADLGRAAWFRPNAGNGVHPVGQKAANAFGLYDMHGNVWELCLDVLPDYGRIPDTDPVGEVRDDSGAMRGGGWMNDAEYCRAACGLRTNDKFGGTGLRIVVNPD
jgi:formylglycine-generating enzyme required for sulfatase activity